MTGRDELTRSLAELARTHRRPYRDVLDAWHKTPPGMTNDAALEWLTDWLAAGDAGTRVVSDWLAAGPGTPPPPAPEDPQVW